jgi:alpha-L-rhamnosidase
MMGACFIVFSCSVPAVRALTAADLRVEYTVNPQGLDVLRPRLSWILTAAGRAQKQTAYQIEVAASIEQLTTGRNIIWNSGKVNSDENFGIVYSGPQLESGSRYDWRVRVWDQDGQASAWSAPAWWEMGMLRPSDWKGKWIGTSSEMTSPLLRREFRLAKKVKRATAYVFGFGWYELHLNGVKVGDNVLAPINSDYRKYLCYDTFDVTRFLASGGNAVGLWLGTGYNRDYSIWGFRWMAAQQALLELDIWFVDGTCMNVVTDASWKASNSPILYNSIYNGETYDARQAKGGWNQFGYDDRAWQAVVLLSPPAGRLRSRLMPPIKVTETLPPREMTQPKPGVYVYDLGQNIAGWVRMRASGAAGTRIVMRYAEDLHPDGTLDATTNQRARATDTFILKGAGIEVYEPRFTYHGFRYVEVTGFPGQPTRGNIEGRVIHSAVQPVGNFQCSNPLLNQIHRNFQWSVLNNLMGIPTDNPVRNERTPCQMDSMAVEETALYNFEMDSYYTKWLDDIKWGGGEVGGTPSDPDWSGDQVFLPMRLYQYYGDHRILDESYENARRLIGLFTAEAARQNPWAEGFGDWCPPGEFSNYKTCYSEGEIVNTCLYYRAMRVVSEMAAILGKASDSSAYADRADAILREFTMRYYRAATHSYGSGKQVTSILPLAFGMVQPSQTGLVANALRERLQGTNQGHFETGIFGTRYLSDVLIDNGLADAALEVLNQTTYPSYGYQISLGATTTWERWQFSGATGSHDHAMFAGPDSTFYSRLAGIRPALPGYREILIRPAFPRGLTFVRSSLRTVMGEIVARWRVQNGLVLEITIPANATAIVYVPTTDFRQVKESGSPATQAVGVRFLHVEDGCAVFSVGSGSYQFTSPVMELSAPSVSTKSPREIEEDKP